MVYNSSRALQLLRLGSGLNDATFRDGQEEAIRHIVDGRGRLLVVQRTNSQPKWNKLASGGNKGLNFATSQE